MNIDAQPQALVAALLRGDEAAFRTFFDTYFPRLYRFARPRLSGDAEAAREVVQATLIKALQGLQDYRAEAALFSWLCQICRHQIIDHQRANQRHVRHLVSIEDDPDLRLALESIEAPDDCPARQYTRAQTRQIIRSVLDHLPGRYGDILEWKYIEGHTVIEIGERLGISQAATQSLLARARTAFHQAIETVFGRTTGEVLADLQGG